MSNRNARTYAKEKEKKEKNGVVEKIRFHSITMCEIKKKWTERDRAGKKWNEKKRIEELNKSSRLALVPMLYEVYDR